MSFKLSRIKPPHKREKCVQQGENGQKSEVKIDVDISQSKCQIDNANGKLMHNKCLATKRQNYKCPTSKISRPSFPMEEGGNGKTNERKRRQWIFTKPNTPVKTAPVDGDVFPNQFSNLKTQRSERRLSPPPQVHLKSDFLKSENKPKLSSATSKVGNGENKSEEGGREGREGETLKYKLGSGVDQGYYNLYFPSRPASPSSETERTANVSDGIDNEVRDLKNENDVHDWSMENDDLLSQEERDVKQGFSSLTDERQRGERISELDKIPSLNTNSESRGLTDEMMNFVESLNNLVPHEYSNLFSLKTDDARWSYLRQLASNMEERDREWKKWTNESREESHRERKRQREDESQNVSTKRGRNESLSMPILSEEEMQPPILSEEEMQPQPPSKMIERGEEAEFGRQAASSSQLPVVSVSAPSSPPPSEPAKEVSFINGEGGGREESQTDNGNVSPEIFQSNTPNLSELAFSQPPTLLDSETDEVYFPSSRTEKNDSNNVMPDTGQGQVLSSQSFPSNEVEEVRPPSFSHLSSSSSPPPPPTKSKAVKKFVNSLRDAIRGRKIKREERNEMRQEALNEINQLADVGIADLVEMPSNYDFDWEDVDFKLKRKKPGKRKRSSSLSNLPASINPQSTRYVTVQPPRKLAKSRGVKRKTLSSGKRNYQKHKKKLSPK